MQYTLNKEKLGIVLNNFKSFKQDLPNCDKTGFEDTIHKYIGALGYLKDLEYFNSFKKILNEVRSTQMVTEETFRKTDQLINMTIIHIEEILEEEIQ